MRTVMLLFAFIEVFLSLELFAGPGQINMPKGQPGYNAIQASGGAWSPHSPCYNDNRCRSPKKMCKCTSRASYSCVDQPIQCCPGGTMCVRKKCVHTQGGRYSCR